MNSYGLDRTGVPRRSPPRRSPPRRSPPRRRRSPPGVHHHLVTRRVRHQFEAAIPSALTSQLQVQRGPSSSATLSTVRDEREQLNERRMNRPDCTSLTRNTEAAPAQS
eukprot:5945934-Pleurochrysis_carterae.AAC.1